VRWDGTRAPLWLALGLATLAACASEPRRDVVRISQTELILRAGPTPPDRSLADWRPQALPDVWGRARRHVATEGWYHAEIHLEQAPEELWAVYLPRVALNAAVFVNGRLVGDGGSFGPQVARNWNTPLLFPVPVGLLAAGPNAIDVRLKMTPLAPGAIAPFEVGPAREVRTAFEWRYLSQVTLGEVVTATTLVTVFLIGVIYLRRDPAGDVRWFMAGVVLWAWSALDSFVRTTPMPERMWLWSQAMAINGFVPCFVVAFHRVRALDRRWLERALAAVAVTGGILLATVSPYDFFTVVLGWMVVTLLLGGYVVALIVAATREQRRQARLFVIPAVLGFGFGVHDVAWIVVARSLPPFLLSPYIAPLAMTATAWTMTVHLVDVLAESERLNRELEQRVQEKHAELEQNYGRLRALERGQAVAAERERIMRDMHDGMGGQLVSTLALVESGRSTPDGVAEALRDALDDLRLVIDSLDPGEQDLLAVLATVRARLEPRLTRHGLRFDWQVVDLPSIPGLGPESVLQALRIVQEAITNVVKHAGARVITVRTGTTNGAGGNRAAFVEVRDDGGGMDLGRRNGRGLTNMARRAAVLGGRVELDSGPGGTAVRLWIPVPDAT
jgi:signal transduction histidine kinase